MKSKSHLLQSKKKEHMQLLLLITNAHLFKPSKIDKSNSIVEIYW